MPGPRGRIRGRPNLFREVAPKRGQSLVFLLFCAGRFTASLGSNIADMIFIEPVGRPPSADSPKPEFSRSGVLSHRLRSRRRRGSRNRMRAARNQTPCLPRQQPHRRARVCQASLSLPSVRHHCAAIRRAPSRSLSHLPFLLAIFACLHALRMRAHAMIHPRGPPCTRPRHFRFRTKCSSSL